MAIYHPLLHKAHKDGYRKEEAINRARKAWGLGDRPWVDIVSHDEQELIDRAKNNRKGV